MNLGTEKEFENLEAALEQILMLPLSRRKVTQRTRCQESVETWICTVRLDMPLTTITGEGNQTCPRYKMIK